MTISLTAAGILARILSQHSFSRAKKNVFKFSLELAILLLVAVNAALTLNPDPKKVFGADNLFLNYLEQHPGLNRVAFEKIKTESLSIVPEQNSFIPAVQAATLNPSTAMGTPPEIHTEGSLKNGPQLLISEDSTIIKPNYATRDAGRNRDIQAYTVQGGDTASKIASSFGVSVQTIMYENKLSAADYLKPGQVLKILPTTGIRHTVASGETLESIAQKYQVHVETILEFNEIEVPDDIGIGEELIIPDGKVQITPSRQTQIAQYSTRNVKQVNVPADFVAANSGLIWPIAIRNITQYFSSKHKALDISNGQRPQFWASGDGIVELSGWDGAYGNSVVLNHGNGLKTRYAHASELYVTAGDRVSSGQVIGRVGNTGRTYGATGLHLHYEIIENGIKANPLKFAK